MNSALMVRDELRQLAYYNAEAEALKAQAIEASSVIGRVTTAEENAAAVDAQIALKTVIDGVTDAKVACKAPVLEFCKLIDATYNHFVSGLKSEQMRLATLVGNYLALEQAKVRAAQAERNLAIQQQERERQAALAQAASHDERDQINTQFDQAAMAVPVPVPQRAPGQVGRQTWEIEVFDLMALLKFHPACVEITPLKRQIYALLDAGVTVQGITAKKVTKASVRVPAQSVVNV